MTQPTRRIGFRTGQEYDEIEPTKQINTAEEKSEEQDESTVMLNDYIPGAIYDGQGNIVTYESFRANIKKQKLKPRILN